MAMWVPCQRSHNKQLFLSHPTGQYAEEGHHSAHSGEEGAAAGPSQERWYGEVTKNSTLKICCVLAKDVRRPFLAHMPLWSQPASRRRYPLLKVDTGKSRHSEITGLTRRPKNPAAGGGVKPLCALFFPLAEK